MHAGRDPSCGRRAAHRRGLSVPPRPGPARPGPARRAARGGGGAGRGDSAGGAKRGAGAGAAAATCAAANKVGRDRSGPGGTLAAPGLRLGGGRDAAPGVAETSPPDARRTSHKALPRSGPQFPPTE